MRHHFHRLRQVARPFVVRQLRGPRARRMIGVSLLFALVTVLMGSWLAFGRGPLERDLRLGIGLEDRNWEGWDLRLDIVCFDEPCSQRPVHEFRERLVADLHEALRIYDPVAHAEFAALHDRALAAARRVPPADAYPDMQSNWGWERPEYRQRLARAIDIDFSPRLVVYVSPLDLHDGIGVIGMLATGLLVVLGTVFAPVLTSIVVAQESHENTLVPITGTGLGGRDVVAGLTLGACAPVAIVAAPQLAIAVLAALAAGDLVVVLGVLALAFACAGLLAMVGVLVGLHVGRRRGPGPVGIGMLALTSLWLLTGIGTGLDRTVGDGELGLAILCPSVPLVLGTREAFFDVADYLGASGVEFAAVTLLPLLAAIVLGVLASRAAGRRVDDRAVPALGLGEATVGALVASLSCVCSIVVMQNGHGDRGLLFGTLAMIAVPLMVLVVARVPAAQGDSPREVALGERMREFGLFVAIHLAVMTALAPELVFSAVPGLVHGTWAVAILALTALRMLCAGNRWLVGTWGGLCLLSAGLMLINATELSSRNAAFEDLAIMFEFGPLFGVLQLVLVVAIPLVLVHGIRRGSAQGLAPRAAARGRVREGSPGRSTPG